MQLDDLILISVDDHVVEPPSLGDFFRENLPAKFKDRAPKVVRKDDGTDAWLIEGQEVATFGLNAVQGRPPENWGSDPSSFDQVRAGRRPNSMIQSALAGEPTRKIPGSASSAPASFGGGCCGAGGGGSPPPSITASASTR